MRIKKSRNLSATKGHTQWRMWRYLTYVCNRKIRMLDKFNLRGGGDQVGAKYIIYTSRGISAFLYAHKLGETSFKTNQ